MSSVRESVEKKMGGSEAEAMTADCQSPFNAAVTGKVLGEVSQERWRQHRKWGEQNPPDADPVLLHRAGGCTAQRMAEHYEMPTATRAKWLCQEFFRRGEGTWAHILVEEVAEAIDATVDCVPELLREELVQVAAVAVAWIEAIDRREHNGSCDEPS